jgi:hypothetical protein
MPQYSIYVGNEVGNPQNSYVGIFGLLSHTEEQDMFVYIYQFSNGRQYIGVGAQNHTDSSGISLCWLSNAPDNRIISWYNLGEGETYTYNTFVTATGELFTGTADYLNNCGFTGHPATNPQTLLSGQYALMNVNQVPGFFNNFWSLVYGGNLLESEY